MREETLEGLIFLADILLLRSKRDNISMVIDEAHALAQRPGYERYLQVVEHLRERIL
jgi:hypothetical protein